MRERDPLQAVVDGELGHARRQHEIADPAPEPQIDHAQPIAGARDREPAARRESRAAAPRAAGAACSARRRRPATTLSRSSHAIGLAARRALLHEHEQPAVEHELRVDRARARIADRLAPRLADRAPQPELAVLPQEPPAVGDRQDQLAARARAPRCAPAPRGSAPAAPRATPAGAARWPTAGTGRVGVEVLDRLAPEHAPVVAPTAGSAGPARSPTARRRPARYRGSRRTSARNRTWPAASYTTMPGDSAAKQVATRPEEPQDPPSALGCHRRDPTARAPQKSGGHRTSTDPRSGNPYRSCEIAVRSASANASAPQAWRQASSSASRTAATCGA